MNTPAEHASAPPPAPRWMRAVLLAAGVYNLVWGAVVVLAPHALHRLLELPPLSADAVPLWQCIGMIVGVYGVGYLAAARDPLRHWPVVLAGFLGKVCGPIGFVWTALQGVYPWRFGVLNVFNDLIWLVPFGLILLRAAQQRRGA